MSKNTITRRAFLAVTTTTALTAWAQGGVKPNTARVVPRKLSPNERLNVAGIGVGGKGTGDIMSCTGENVVALCDADHKRAGESFYRLKKAKQYWDYRKMFDEMADAIDACTISTPDHTHAPAAYMAMKLGKHVYVQKPLTHTLAEARLLTKTAREMGVATQMGNQGQAGNAVREVCEMIWAGAIGNVREAHIWTDRPGEVWPQGIPKPLPEEPVREKLDWDLWIGAAPMRPYNGGYCPRSWRGWWDFGCGALGDMGCHNMNPAWWSLKIGEAKTYTVELVQEDGNNDQTGPNASIIKYTVPARAGMGPVEVYWYDGSLMPKRPEALPEGAQLGAGDNGSLFIGDAGILTFGVNGDDARIYPEERSKDFKRPEPTLPRIREENPYLNWIDACKGGVAACSNFDYSGPLTEFVNFGNVALRTGSRMNWDCAKFEITNDKEANRFLTKEYRKGWELPV